jgi:hypothetical protein
VSEYQYYEFVAVDRPLTVAQQSELRALSTRARITPSSFVNDYQWGDLKVTPGCGWNSISTRFCTGELGNAPGGAAAAGRGPGRGDGRGVLPG